MSFAATLVLLRHAAVDCSSYGHALLCGRHDIPLSDLGRRQVAALRQRLDAEAPFDALYSSPLMRTLQTARAAPDPLIGSLRVLNSLAEIHCGAFDGLPIKLVRERYPDLWRHNESQTDEEFCWPGGESYRKFRNRVMRAVRTIVRLHAGQRVLIVTHAGVVNQVIGTVVGQSAARWHNYRPRNASLTCVSWDPEGGHIETFNDCAHLPVSG